MVTLIKLFTAHEISEQLHNIDTISSSYSRYFMYVLACSKAELSVMCWRHIEGFHLGLGSGEPHLW